MQRQLSRGGDSSAKAHGGGGSTGNGVVMRGSAAMMTRSRESSGTNEEGTRDPAAAAAAAAAVLAAAPGTGVVIRVFISGAHASFLHIRVFPSTTAGQVRVRGATTTCRPVMQSVPACLLDAGGDLHFSVCSHLQTLEGVPASLPLSRVDGTHLT